MKHLVLTLQFLLIFCSIIDCYAQKAATVNFFNQIKNYNLSLSLNADSIETEGEEGGLRKVKREEILGFIGNHYQRLQIHFNSIIKNPKNPNQYYVFGKTKVYGLIFPFNGVIIIKQAYLYTKRDIKGYKQGFVDCEVTLNENKRQAGSGFIRGKLKSNFEINAKGQFGYDALLLVSDSFSNNEVVGTWTSYQTNELKKCNWGDYRIPNSGNLDSGAGEFYVSEKYLKNGWESYMRERKMLNQEKPEKRQDKNWWK